MDEAGVCGLSACWACAAVPEESNVVVVWYLPALLCAGAESGPLAEPAVSGEDERSCWKISLPSPAAAVCCRRREQAELSPLGNVLFPLRWVHA